MIKQVYGLGAVWDFGFAKVVEEPSPCPLPRGEGKNTQLAFSWGRGEGGELGMGDVSNCENFNGL